MGAVTRVPSLVRSRDASLDLARASTQCPLFSQRQVVVEASVFELSCVGRARALWARTMVGSVCSTGRHSI